MYRIQNDLSFFFLASKFRQRDRLIKLLPLRSSSQPRFVYGRIARDGADAARSNFIRGGTACELKFNERQVRSGCLE